MKKLFIVFTGLVISLITSVGAHAVLLGPGESATFRFDFGEIDLSSANSLFYNAQTTDPFGNPSPWEGRIEIFDDLSEPPVQRSEFFFDFDFGTNSLPVLTPSLFDDPLVWLRVTHLPGVATPADSIIDIVWRARASFDGDVFSAWVPGQVITVPEPSAMLLMIGGLLALRWRSSKHVENR